jgi:hypothetical protein
MVCIITSDVGVCIVTAMSSAFVMTFVKVTDGQRASKVISGAEGKRLTYRPLKGDVDFLVSNDHKS